MTRDPRGAKPWPIRTASPVLRELLETADLYGVSIADLAVRTNYSTQSISAWRGGHHAPNILAVEDIASVLGYHLELVRNDE